MSRNIFRTKSSKDQATLWQGVPHEIRQPAKFVDHMNCVSRDVVLVVQVQDSIRPCLNRHYCLSLQYMTSEISHAKLLLVCPMKDIWYWSHMSDANSLKIFCLSVQKQRRGGKGEKNKNNKKGNCKAFCMHKSKKQ